MPYYFEPPPFYKQAGRCEECEQLIMFGPVIGGQKWRHVTAADHDVVMRDEGWWDTATGEIVHGNPVLPADRLPPSVVV